MEEGGKERRMREEGRRNNGERDGVVAAQLSGTG